MRPARAGDGTPPTTRARAAALPAAHGAARPSAPAPAQPPPPPQPPAESHASSTATPTTRRAALFTAAALAAVAPPLPRPPPAHAADGATDPDPSTTPTGRVFLDIGLCPGGFRPDRALGDASALCSDPDPLGRIVIDLYGRLAPATAAQFAALASAGDLDGTLIHKVFPGRFIAGGRQGPRRMGGLAPSTPLPDNPDLLAAGAFRARHLRPGTVSLAVAASDDEPVLKARPGYRPAGFTITTGPGPVPALDGGNIVFGRVSEGLDVVASVSKLPALGPTPGPFNALADLLGDERGARARARYGQPLRLVVVTKAGVLK
jgi:peptidyl-prolyl cis-trans isomerase B (cyclophilin B)